MSRGPAVTAIERREQRSFIAERMREDVTERLRIAAELERFGMTYIEGGWPGSNPRDVEFFARAKKIKFKHAKLAAFGSTRRKGVRASEDAQVRGLLEVDTPVVTIYGKTSALHVREVLRCSPEENLEMIRDTVAYLKSHRREVVYDCEHAIDGWKDDPAYAIASMLAAVEGGADPKDVAPALRHCHIRAADHEIAGDALVSKVNSLAVLASFKTISSVIS